MILCQLEVEILLKLDFHGGHLKKWPEPISRTKVISRSIANNIPRKPPIQIKSGGCAWLLILAHGLATCVNY